MPRGRGSGPPWTTNGGPRGTGRKPRHHDDYPHGAVMPVMPVTVQARGGWLVPLRSRTLSWALSSWLGRKQCGDCSAYGTHPREAPGRGRSRPVRWHGAALLAPPLPTRSAEGTCPGQHSGECGAPVPNVPGGA
ncbi:hypothetical protein JCM3263A_10400 [Thermobifida fusca]